MTKQIYIVGKGSRLRVVLIIFGALDLNSTLKCEFLTKNVNLRTLQNDGFLSHFIDCIIVTK